MQSEILLPGGVGLAIGIAFVILFAVYSNNNQTISHPTQIAVITIPQDAVLQTSGKSYEPSSITVVLGINNTVMWINHENVAAMVSADNYADPDFFNATGDNPAFILPNQTFSFTFAKPGIIGYHGKPWQQGTVIVLPPRTALQTQTSLSPYIPDPDTAVPCPNVIVSHNGTDIVYTCSHPQGYKPDSPIVFHLPSPTYKKVACTSTYGCAYRYVYQEIIPANLLTDQQKQIIVSKALSLNETRENRGWKLDSISIRADQDKWYAQVQLVLPNMTQLPPSQECGWYGSVEFNLETLQVVNIENIPTRSTVSC